jgi:hypothetical protein
MRGYQQLSRYNCAFSRIIQVKNRLRHKFLSFGADLLRLGEDATDSAKEREGVVAGLDGK